MKRYYPISESLIRECNAEIEWGHRPKTIWQQSASEIFRDGQGHKTRRYKGKVKAKHQATQYAKFYR